MPYYEQPGRTTAIDKDGKTIITVTFVGTEEALQPSDLTGTVKSKSVTKDIAGQIRTQLQIESDVNAFNPVIGSGARSEGNTIEIVACVRTVPIEAHPNFSEPYLYPKDKKQIKDAVQLPDRSPTFDDATDPKRATSLYGYLISGIESYYVPSLVVRKTYQASSPPTANKVGKIANPGVTISGMPKLANFLLINVSARGAIGAYTVTEEYEMSGEGGWDTFLYT